MLALVRAAQSRVVELRHSPTSTATQQQKMTPGKNPSGMFTVYIFSSSTADIHFSFSIISLNSLLPLPSSSLLPYHSKFASSQVTLRGFSSSHHRLSRRPRLHQPAEVCFRSTFPLLQLLNHILPPLPRLEIPIRGPLLPTPLCFSPSLSSSSLGYPLPGTHIVSGSFDCWGCYVTDPSCDPSLTQNTSNLAP
jgi:hypothetical protein